MKDVFGPVINQFLELRDNIHIKQLPSPSSGGYIEEPWSVECTKCWKDRFNIPIMTSPPGTNAREMIISFGGDYEVIVKHYVYTYLKS